MGSEESIGMPWSEREEGGKENCKQNKGGVEGERGKGAREGGLQCGTPSQIELYN